MIFYILNLFFLKYICIEKGIGKIAKKLGVDYGEAVIGFEFRKKRANPIINGIVIDEVFKDTVIDVSYNIKKN